MRYFRTARFKRAFRTLEAPRQIRVEHAMRQLEVLFESGHLPPGLGLKQLRPGLWEVRAGLSDRVVFSRTGDLAEFLLVGNHDELRRFLK